jgi:subtilisin family serine protease
MRSRAGAHVAPALLSGSAKMRPPLRPFLLLLTVAVSVAFGQTTAPSKPKMPDRTPQYVPDQLLVRFRSTASTQAASQMHSRVHARAVRRYTTLPGLQLVQLEPGVDFNAALSQYRSDPSVLYAEPNYIRKALDNTPNDTYFHDLWNMHNTGQPILFPYPPFSGPTAAIPGADIHALEAWGITTGSSDVVIGLVDTGIDVNHEDLAANVYRNTADCFTDGIDHDGNGYINDCNGWNALDGNNDLTDLPDHGTHVAGIMGAVGNNGVGVTGVNWNVKIITCKFLGIYGGTDDGAIACVNYIDTMKDKGVNIVVTNNSWGGYGYSQALYDAFDTLRQRGILVVAAAGNESNDNDGLYPLYPASFALDNVVGVAASDFTDAQSYYSNFGTHTVGISAPGDYILSTTPGSTYSIYSGTSMATPHVSGVAALLKAQDPTRDWKAIRNLILTGGDVLPNVASSLTHSRLNAFNSVTCQNRTLTVPTQPQSPSVFANSGQPVTFGMLNVNCAAPAGAPAVTVTQTGQQVSLHDDGATPDQDANDGIYSGQWTPSQSGLYTVGFPGGQQLQVAADPYSASSADFHYRTFTGTNLNLTDESYAIIDPPFPISFPAGAYAYIAITDNGYLSFDTLLPSTSLALPYSYAFTVIAPFWDNLVPAAGGNVFWTVNGTAPNRELVIEWRNMSHAGCKADGSETVTFQVVIFENTTDILFNYLNTVFGGDCTASDNGATASVGVQSTDKVAQQLSFHTTKLSSSSAVSWKSTLPVNRVPTLAAVNPKSWATDIYDLFVELTGTNFNYDSVVLVNGAPAQTYVFSQTDLFFDLPPTALANIGTLQLTLFNGSPGGGPSNAIAFPIKADDFTIEPPYGVTVKAGQSTNATVWVFPNPAFQGGVTLSCSGLPANLSCTFNPASILTDSYSVVTFTAKPLSSASTSVSASLVFCFPVVGLLWIAAWNEGPRRRLTPTAIAVASLVIGLLLGCGGSSGPRSGSASQSSGGGLTTTGGGSGTGSGGSSGSGSTTGSGTGTYNVTITGTSGSIQHSVTFGVTVTP